MSFDDKDSEKHLEPRKKCPKCGKKGFVYYRKSEVLQGDPFSSDADSQVKHFYECENCGLRFAEIT